MKDLKTSSNIEIDNIDITMQVSKTHYDGLVEKIKSKNAEIKKLKGIIKNFNENIQTIQDNLQNSKKMFDSIREYEKIIKQTQDSEISLKESVYKLEESNEILEKEIMILRDNNKKYLEEINELKKQIENTGKKTLIQDFKTSKSSTCISDLKTLNNITVSNMSKDQLIKKIEDIEISLSNNNSNFFILLNKYDLLLQEYAFIKDENEKNSNINLKLESSLNKKKEENEKLLSDLNKKTLLLDKMKDNQFCYLETIVKSCILNTRNNDKPSNKGLESCNYIFCEPTPSYVKLVINKKKNSNES